MMIYSLSGTVQFKQATALVVNVNNVGYLVQCTIQTLSKLAIQDPIDLIIYHHIREDTQSLFGFETEYERECFELLLSVSGIGPKVALGILSNMKMTDFISAIQTDNIMLITQCPGIGKKTAERMIIELKDKVQTMAGVSPKIIEKEASENHHDSDDIVMALRQLGYQKEEIKRGFMKHAKELSTVSSIEDQIKILLKYL
tara:strand:- start:497 stop:1096 length:600 start_codon:yes stop_codon:yes gene_type:complete